MENNKICEWLLYYSKDNISWKCSENIESAVAIKEMLCSSVSYFDCGGTLLKDFPEKSTGFTGIFDYLSNDKGNVMDKMKTDEQQAYINQLVDRDNFSMRHHVTIIKCLMKSYVCQLAPLEIIRKALQGMGVLNNFDNGCNLATYRHIQRNLIIWLKECATRGLRVLLTGNKNVSETQICEIINTSTTGSLIIYALMYYASAKMTKYTIRLPDVDLHLSNGSSKVDLAFDHSRMVLLAFADICDKKDILPLDIDCLISRAIDTVPSTLTIALIFHWTFGNSLKHLENLMKMSLSSTNSDQSDMSPSHPSPCHTLFGTTNDIQGPKSFFISNNCDSNKSLRQLFSNKKEENDAYSERVICQAPTENMPKPFFKSITPSSLSDETVNMNYSNESLPLSLKNEFQKKLQQKQNLIKQKPSNETTWMAQSSKNEITRIPMTPKKTMKPTDVINQNDQIKTVTKTQMNEIQMQLSFQRKKIENDKKCVAEKTGKIIENSKQIAFFQAVAKGTKIVRRKSLESLQQSSNNNACGEEKRLSMFVPKTQDCLSFSPPKNVISQDNVSEMVKDFVDSCEKFSLDSLGNPMKGKESPVLLQASEIDLNPTDISTKQATDISENVAISSKDLCNPSENIISISRKNSSPSISSLSSCSNTSLENIVNKNDFKQSLELITLSLTSLQDELRMLNQKQYSRNKDSFQISVLSSIANDTKVDSENNSVAETPMNNGISLTEISELAKCSIKTSSYSVNDPTPVILPTVENSVEDNNLNNNSVDDLSVQIKEIEVQQNEDMMSVSGISVKMINNQSLNEEHKMFIDQGEPSLKADNKELLAESSSETMKEDFCVDMTSSLESVVVSNVQPVAFIIADNQIDSDAIKKQAELLAKREQRRLFKLEMFRQRREQERDNKQSASNEELLERELIKKLEQEKREVLLQKHLDSKNEENTTSFPSLDRRSLASAKSSIKSAKFPITPKTSLKTTKQESVENLTLGSNQRNGWFSSMRENHRKTSLSTSKLNTNCSSIDGIKLSTPMPSQDYVGPKLFGKRKVKTNRTVISNAISYCCLAGSVNVHLKDSVLKELSESDGTHFMILFRDTRCQYRSLYVFDLITEDLQIITGNGPKRVTHDMVEVFYKYNSGAKQFNTIVSTKHLSTAVDAICIHSVHWNMRPTGQLLSGAVSTTSISRAGSKRLP